jgi:hypothetical protein
MKLETSPIINRPLQIVMARILLWIRVAANMGKTTAYHKKGARTSRPQAGQRFALQNFGCFAKQNFFVKHEEASEAA